MTGKKSTEVDETLKVNRTRGRTVTNIFGGYGDLQKGLRNPKVVLDVGGRICFFAGDLGRFHVFMGVQLVLGVVLRNAGEY